MTKPLVFYDIPTVLKEGEGPSQLPMSPSAWRARYALNIKKIPYSTTWTEMAGLREQLQKLGVPPTTVLNGESIYTVPTVYDPNTSRAVTDSQNIIQYLEEHYPDTPSLFPPNTHALQFVFVSTLYPNLARSIWLLVAAEIFDLCSERDQVRYRQTREPLFGGTKIEDIELKGEPRIAAISKVVEDLSVIDQAIRANGEHATFLASSGDIPSNADINLAAIFTWVRRVNGDEGDLWKSILAAHDGRWAKYMQAFEKFQTVV